MLKFLRNKIQSLSETQLNILTAILVLVNIGIVIFWINFWLSSPKLTPPVIEQPASIISPLKPGEIGEPKTGETPTANLPKFIFNTTGTVKEIQKDKLVVLGSGSNFSDKEKRELTLIFTEGTVTFESGQKIKYQGLEGLKHLKIDEKISISSFENIRGKTQFIVNTINK